MNKNPKKKNGKVVGMAGKVYIKITTKTKENWVNYNKNDKTRA